MQIMGYEFGGSLTLYNHDQKEVFSVTPGSLTVSDRENAKQIFSVEQDGLLNLKHIDGKPILQAGRSQGHGYIQVQDEDGNNSMYGPAYR